MKDYIVVTEDGREFPVVARSVIEAEAKVVRITYGRACIISTRRAS